MTSAPAPLARLELPSAEPSSTTITEGRYRLTAVTRGAMVFASLKQVMTATHVVISGTRPACSQSTRESRQNSRSGASQMPVLRRGTAWWARLPTCQLARTLAPPEVESVPQSGFALPDDGMGLYFGIELNDASYALSARAGRSVVCHHVFALGVVKSH